ncbi:MAG TPA: tetratricopeptide repeat protein [Fimbriimonadales bacterium]|nr:tetratricopeptide repeat protein [Fimbriimonadales bacterium]
MASVQDPEHTLNAQTEALYEKGFASRCEGDYASARKYFQEVMERVPGHIKARWQLALIKGFEGDFDGSLADLAQLVQDAPNDPEVRYDYAMTLMMLGFFDEGCEQLREVLRLKPDHEKAKQQLQYCGG